MKKETADVVVSNNLIVDDIIVEEDITPDVDDIIEEDTVDETVDMDENAAPPTQFGVVTDCVKLNIRKYPNRNAEIVAEVPANTELMINPDNTTHEWYSVCTSSGVEGFCMKQYVTIKP